MGLKKLTKKLIICAVLLLTAACSGLQSPKATAPVIQTISASNNGSLLANNAPIFRLEEADKSYNRIGTPRIREKDNGDIEAYVDSSQATIYAMEQPFSSQGEQYTNLIYRVHFEKTPFNHLTAGKNVGLIAVITLNSLQQPILLTTVHTCGCYFAIIPTSSLPNNSYPQNWSMHGQEIYGERLSSLINMEPAVAAQHRFVIAVRSETHRVMQVTREAGNENFHPAALQPMTKLRQLPVGERKISFFETTGSRKGYVRNSIKPYERLLMSWWSLDWRVGEDKDFGSREQTGTIFNTSLKFWARQQSNMWNFAKFLNYWGWRL